MSVKNAPTVSVRPKKRRVFYPETDGKPMAEGDVQRDMMVDIINPLRRHFREQPDVHVTGNLMFYYIKGDNRTYTSPAAMVVKGVSKVPRQVFCLWRERVRLASSLRQKFRLTDEEIIADCRRLKATFQETEAARQQTEMLLAQDEEIARLRAKLKQLGGA